MPKDFGLAALGMLVIAFVESVQDLGIGQAVIYRADDPNRTGSVDFGINLVVGVDLTTLAYLGAPLVGDFFDEPRLVPWEPRRENAEEAGGREHGWERAP